MKIFITITLTTLLLITNTTFATAETISTNTTTISTSTASVSTISNAGSSTPNNYSLLDATQTPPMDSIMQAQGTNSNLMKAETSSGGFIAKVYTYYPQSDKLMYTFLLYDHNEKDTSYGRYAELIDMPTDATSLVLPDSITFNGYTYHVRDITLMSDNDYSVTSLTVPDTLYHMFINPNVPKLKNINLPKIVDREPDISCSTNYTMSQFNMNRVDYNKDIFDNFRIIKPLTKNNVGSDYICDVDIGYYSYSLRNDGTAKVVGYKFSAEKTITVPSNVQYDNFNYLVTSIGSRAFNNDYMLNTIILPSSISTLESWAFYVVHTHFTVLYSNPNLSMPTNPFSNSDLGTLTYQANPNEKAPSAIGIINTPTIVTSTSTATTSTAKTGDVSSLSVVLASLAGIAGVGVFKKRK